MVSDSELVGRLCEFLSTSDLTTTTTATVRRKLEEEFGIDLSDKKAFIREQVDLYLQTQFEKSQENGEEQEDAEAEEEEGEEEDEEEEEEGTNNGKAKIRKRSKKQNKQVKRRGGGGGFTKVCSLSPQLQKFTGVPELARTEVVKQLWSYIRENNLQDPSNRRNIMCDEALHDLFNVESINMFQMNKALAKHIWSLDSDGAGPVNTTPKEKQCKQEREEVTDLDEPKRKEKRQKGGNTGILAPVPLSDALVKFLGTGETALSRSDVVKRIWVYIKQNNLQDPSDKRRIISDEKLRELFNVETFIGFTVSKLLTAHFIKAEL